MLRSPHLFIATIAAALGLLLRGLRPSGSYSGDVSWVFGWVPILCYALGASAAILALARWFTKNPRRGRPAVFTFVGVNVAYAFRKLGEPSWSIAWGDLTALLLGVGLVLLVDRWVVAHAADTTPDPSRA